MAGLDESKVYTERSPALGRVGKVLGFIAVWAGLMYGANQFLSRDRSYDGDDLTRIMVPMGFFSHEEYNIGAGVKYSTWTPFYSEHFNDGNIYGKEDGLVDRIHTFSSFGSSRSLDRSKHFESHTEEFGEADKTFADATARFVPYFKK